MSDTSVDGLRAWRKSSFSGATGCVEVRMTDSGVQVRDSKELDSPILDFTAHEWDSFLRGVQKGEFDIVRRSDPG